MSLNKIKETLLTITGGTVLITSLILSTVALYKNENNYFDYNKFFCSEEWKYEMAKISINSGGAYKIDAGRYFKVNSETVGCDGSSIEKLVHGQKNDEFVMFGNIKFGNVERYKALLKRNGSYHNSEIKVTLRNFNNLNTEFIYELVSNRIGIKSETNILSLV
ncbi:MAG: hypothetical protein RsTaC01_0612 [Candidatus Paraimprobicoccus trichonymphae]|uniref:Uncharacterized protein n=1 Tax=Candidatus Paraimprobicoccus trichonymphae TaxID=3033793 RepID=A0AA48HZV3_9FIRM|nr:MAG: hypothetical protein RsTaC01_0612 [Candidatus Paraimprobicoccus trichonymphae]